MPDLPIDLDPQRCFTRRQKAEMILRSRGLCDLCGDKIKAGVQWVAGHIIAHGLGGRTTLDNAQVECSGCSKGTQKSDAGICAKADRQATRTGQQARRKRNGSRLQSRGFDKSLKRKLNGKTERRTK